MARREGAVRPASAREQFFLPAISTTIGSRCLQRMRNAPLSSSPMTQRCSLAWPATRMTCTVVVFLVSVFGAAGWSEAGWWSDWGNSKEQFVKEGKDLYEEHRRFREELGQTWRTDMRCDRNFFADVVQRYAELIKKSYAGGAISDAHNDKLLEGDFLGLSTEMDGDLLTFLNQYLEHCCPRERADQSKSPPGDGSGRRPSDTGGSGRASSGAGESGTSRAVDGQGETIRVDPARSPVPVPDWMRHPRPQETGGATQPDTLPAPRERASHDPVSTRQTAVSLDSSPQEGLFLPSDVIRKALKGRQDAPPRSGPTEAPPGPHVVVAGQEKKEETLPAPADMVSKLSRISSGRPITINAPAVDGTFTPQLPPPDVVPKHPPKDLSIYPEGTVPPEPLPKDAGPRAPSTYTASCCESCPSNKQERYYVPIAPDTDCQPGDVRRDDLSLEKGTCANPLVETAAGPGPWTFGPACCDKQTARMLYDTVPSADDVTSQVGSVLRGGGCPDDPCKLAPVTPDGERPKEVDVSILSTAPGPNGRNWVPEHPVLRLGKERLKPCAQSKFYVTKEATGSGREAATAIFSAISAEYAQEAAHAADSPGTACPSHGGGGRSRAREAHDKATAAAGLALLASQAKGQITGLRATFNVTGKEGQLNDAKLEADIVNEVTQKKVWMNLPVRFESSNPSQ